MLDIHIVYSDPKDLQLLNITNSKQQPFIHSYYINSLEDRSKGFKLKAAWGAKLDPFVYLEIDGKPHKCFYTETGENAVSQLIKFLQK